MHLTVLEAKKLCLDARELEAALPQVIAESLVLYVLLKPKAWPTAQLA